MASYVDITNTLNFAVSFKPTSAFPIDSRTMFGSKAAAEAAAKTAKNAGSAESIYYYGMPLTVFENDEATMYVINGDGSLKETGKATYGDNKTITLDAATGALSLKSFGKEYFAYREADTIIESGDYAYPDNMPLDPADKAYVQIGGTWYQYKDAQWAVAATTPSKVPYYEKVTGWIDGLVPKAVGNEHEGFSLAWYQPSSTTVEGLSDRIAALQTRTDGLEKRVATAETDIGNLKVTTNNNTAAITKLNADAQTEGSVKYTVAAEVAKIVGGASSDFDTLKELQDWITTHGGDAAQMNSSISANATAIKALETLVGQLPEGAKATTVINYIGEAVTKEMEKLGTAAYRDANEFATAAQGAKAETAVQSVVAGTSNGYIKVDSKDVKVYEAPIATDSALGAVKTGDPSIVVDETGKLSVGAVDPSKVTGLDNMINTAVSEGDNAVKEHVAANFVGNDKIVTSATLNTEQASDLKVASEKALVDSLTWKTSM